MQSFVLSLTIFRILAAPIVFIAAIFLENNWLAFCLFNLAALTDYFDGKLARDFRVESSLGAILDPIGDKLLLMFAIISVIVFTQDIYVALMSTFILARELWVSGLREYSSAQGIVSATKVTFVDKTKTAVQFIAISMFFLGAATELAFVSFLASFALLLAIFLAYKSAIDYTFNTFKN